MVVASANEGGQIFLNLVAVWYGSSFHKLWWPDLPCLSGHVDNSWSLTSMRKDLFEQAILQLFIDHEE